MSKTKKAVFPTRVVTSVPVKKAGPYSGLDGDLLARSLGTIVGRKDLNAADKRTRTLGLLKETMDAAKLSAREQFEMGRLNGLEMARLLAKIHEDIVTSLFHSAMNTVFGDASASETERLALVAVGGFGRGEMAPGSDLDLLFLQTDKKDGNRVGTVTEYVLYMLWDLGLKVGHATRTVDQSLKFAKSDQTILTAMLDMRFLTGDEKLFTLLEARFRRMLNRGKGRDYIQEKLRERDLRHTREGNSRYVIEPNVKEGKGGLRDLHVLYWIARYLDRDGNIQDPQQATDYVEMGLFDKFSARRFVRAADFLWRTRIHLHFLSERHGETLHFDKQVKLARKMGYATGETIDVVEKFMREYFLNAREVGALTRIACAKLEAQNALTLPKGLDMLLPRSRGKVDHPDFKLDHGRITFKDPLQIKLRPRLIMELFLLAGRRNTDIHPDAISAIAYRRNLIDNNFRKDPEISEIFQQILLTSKAPGRTMKVMNEADILGRYLLEFGGIVARTQFNMHHAYTVDEHTLRLTIGFHDLLTGQLADGIPVASEFVKDFTQEQKLIVYMATLLHDTGKGKGDQSIEGAHLSRKACKRMGLSPNVTETVSWLVRRHLDMSETAQRRDVSDPETIAEFAALVGSPERLEMLMALTIVDIRAVGPGIWNDWKAVLLRQLYHNTMSHLKDGGDNLAPRARVDTAREALSERLPEALATAALPEMKKFGRDYWLGFEVTDHVRHARWIAGLDNPETAKAVKARLNKPNDVTELWVLCHDRELLFANLTRAIASVGASVVGARLCTAKDGRVFDVFYLQNTEGLAFGRKSPNQLDRLVKRTQTVADGQASQAKPSDSIKSPRSAAIPVKAKVKFSEAASSDVFVIDLSGRDRPGLLHELAEVMGRAALDILSAHIEVVGPEAIDAFYVRPRTGQTLPPKTLKTLKAELLAILDPV